MSDQESAAADETAEPAGMPYQEVTDQSFAEAGAKFDVAEIVGGFTLRGACPRCCDVMEYSWVHEVVRTADDAANQPKVITVICTCVVNHPGSTAESRGCGAYWNLRVEA